MLWILEERLDDKVAEVDTGLDSDDAASRKGATDAEVTEHGVLVGIVGVAAGIVGVHAEVVAQTVREESNARPALKNLLLVALENTNLEKAVNGNLVRQEMDIIPEDALLQRSDTLVLHLEDDIVDFPALLGELAVDGESTGDVRGIAIPLASRIEQKVELASHVGVVGNVVKSGRSSAAGDDAVVGLVAGALGDAVSEEDGLQLALVLNVLHLLHDQLVSLGADLVGLGHDGQFVFVLDHARDFDGFLEDGKVLVVEFEEGDLVRDLVGDRKYGRALGLLAADMGEGGVDIAGVLDLVDVPVLLGLFGGDRQARPDDRLGIDGWDEEGGLVGVHVVHVVAVGEGAAGHVVEVAALAERLGLVVVLEQLGGAALEVEDSRCAGHLVADVVGDALRMALGRVFALEGGLVIHSGGGGHCAVAIWEG